jgi:hypothetical protein
MEKIERTPQEIKEVSESTKSAEAQKLDDATYEPRAAVERAGDFKQSETIQAAFTAVVANTAAEANRDLSNVHTSNETYYTGERGSGPHPHTFGEDRKPAEEEDDGDKTRTGFPSMNEPGPTSYLDSDGSTSGSNDLNLVPVEPPPPPPDRTEGGGTPAKDFSLRIADNKVTAISDQTKWDKTKPIDAHVDPDSDNGIGDPIAPSVTADIGQPDTISGQQPHPVAGAFRPKDGDGSQEESTPVIPLPPPNASMETKSNPITGTSGHRMSTEKMPEQIHQRMVDNRDTVSGQQPTYSIDPLIDRALHDEAGADHYGARHIEDHTIKPPDSSGEQQPAHVPVSDRKSDESQSIVDDRGTVSGQQPKLVDGAFQKKGDGDDDGGKENITPINLPGVRDETRPVHTSAGSLQARDLTAKPMVAGANQRETVTGLDSKLASIEQSPIREAPDSYPTGFNDNAPTEFTSRITDDRSTVSGQQPKFSIDALVDHALHDEAGADHYGPRHVEDQTMKPLDSRTEMRPAHDPAPETGTPGKFDSDTGMVKNPTKGDGEASPPLSPPSVHMVKQSWTQVEDQKPSEPRRAGPPQMVEPSGDAKVAHTPYVPVKDVPPPAASGTQGGGKVNSPFGPQEINSRFAEQALNAIGLSAAGVVTVHGTTQLGGARGYGPGAPESQMPVAPGNENSGAYESHGSSKSGAPVHRYGLGTVGLEHEDTHQNEDKNGSNGNSGGGSGNVVITEGVKDPKGLGGGAPLIFGEGTNCVNAVTFNGVICKTPGGSYYAWKSNTLDGGSPMPFTGTWSAGKFEPKDPSTVGGREKEGDSGHIMPVLRHGGLGYQGAGNNATDGTSIWDDGHFYGGIFGGGSNILSDNQPGVVDPAQAAENIRKATRK